jgi:hypothetical protein
MPLLGVCIPACAHHAPCFRNMESEPFAGGTETDVGAPIGS